MTNESKRDRFKRVAEKRTKKILKMMELLGNCSNKNNYDYTEDDVNKIIKVIEEQLRILKFKYKESSKENFQL